MQKDPFDLLLQNSALQQSTEALTLVKMMLNQKGGTFRLNYSWSSKMFFYFRPFILSPFAQWLVTINYTRAKN